jgi:hypothetical protein
MAIDSVSNTSENVPNQDQVTVVREGDGSVSIFISADASATASAGDQSSTQSVTGTEQARSDVDGTNTDYPTDRAGESDTTINNDEVLARVSERLEEVEADLDEILSDMAGDDRTVEPSENLFEFWERLEGILGDLGAILGSLKPADDQAQLE